MAKPTLNRNRRLVVLITNEFDTALTMLAEERDTSVSALVRDVMKREIISSRKVGSPTETRRAMQEQDDAAASSAGAERPSRARTGRKKKEMMPPDLVQYGGDVYYPPEPKTKSEEVSESAQP